MPETQAKSRIRPCTNQEREAMLVIINAAAEVYRGVIPADCWRQPYMPLCELADEIGGGVSFWGYEADGTILGIMGIQKVHDVHLIRHAYVSPHHQNQGIGDALLTHLRSLGRGRMLVGTWAVASWAIRFYEKRGFSLAGPERNQALLKQYWRISERQIATSVVLETQVQRK